MAQEPHPLPCPSFHSSRSLRWQIETSIYHIHILSFALLSWLPLEQSNLHNSHYFFHAGSTHDISLYWVAIHKANTQLEKSYANFDKFIYCFNQLILKSFTVTKFYGLQTNDNDLPSNSLYRTMLGLMDWQSDHCELAAFYCHFYNILKERVSPICYICISTTYFSTTLLEVSRRRSNRVGHAPPPPPPKHARVVAYV